MSNNPTVDVLTEIQEYNAVLSALGSGHKVSKPSMVVSLGTGAKPTEEVIRYATSVELYQDEYFLNPCRLSHWICSDLRVS